MEILRRLEGQPGIILADEVGMGKTFVALAVAVSVALSYDEIRPAVVMVPSSLSQKWPRDFALFREKCLDPGLREKVRCAEARTAAQLLRLLDDPPSRRSAVIFLTHGAMNSRRSDVWIQLALIYQSLHRRWGSAEIRRNVSRYMGRILRRRDLDEEIWLRLLDAHPRDWLTVLKKYRDDGGRVRDQDLEDDPVPSSLWKALPELDVSELFDSLNAIPTRSSKNEDVRVDRARSVVTQAAAKLWKECLSKVRFELPLLVLDEAHHLKNAATRLATLFHYDEYGSSSGDLIGETGLLAGVFERMLFLTATPFQLGHGELCSVMDRFDGVNWRSWNEPDIARRAYREARSRLRHALDAAQEASIRLDGAWGRLDGKDVLTKWTSPEQWWRSLQTRGDLDSVEEDVRHAFKRANRALRESENELKRWVIRHQRSRHFESDVKRRQRLAGRAIVTNSHDSDSGLEVSGKALLPFLLAARASYQSPDKRPVFAEGLASSYEAFLHTRTASSSGLRAVDLDDESDGPPERASNWYLDQLERLLPLRTDTHEDPHPKVSATVGRAISLWENGEKVVVFCHYIATGRLLRQRISASVNEHVIAKGAERLGCAREDVLPRLDTIGNRFHKADSRVRRACEEYLRGLISEFPGLEAQADDLVEVVCRNLRTPSFLVRFFPLEREFLDNDAVSTAFSARDASRLTLADILRQFFSFLVDRCSEKERVDYILAIKGLQTGTHTGSDMTGHFGVDELQGTPMEKMLPNVRLVNGDTKPETRQRLMLTFNTPFFPEILVASSVMAEGVDLHLNCRYIIHHDLCWNPSTLEQRTGRVDRIGAKAERARQPIHVYLPYIAETQDEKMYRVVMDRERWFNVVMGENYPMTLRDTERLAERLPFPEEAARALAFDLRVFRG